MQEKKLTSYTATHEVWVKAGMGEINGRTTFDEVVVGVASEESVGKERDDGVHSGHVQYSDAVKIELQHRFAASSRGTYICRCSPGFV